MAGSVYKFEDVYSFLVPEKMPPFWVEMAGVSYCNGYYHIDREESDVTVIEYTTTERRASPIRRAYCFNR